MTAALRQPGIIPRSYLWLTSGSPPASWKAESSRTFHNHLAHSKYSSKPARQTTRADDRPRTSAPAACLASMIGFGVVSAPCLDCRVTYQISSMAPQ